MKESITGSIVANWVRMFRQGYSGAILLIEGESDARLYSRVIDKSSCSLINANNKQNVLDALKILDAEKFVGVAGIVDADFDRLAVRSLPSKNILMTDTHDLETLLLTSPSLENVLSSYGSTQKLRRLTRPIRELLIDSALPFGYLRWISLMEDMSVDFKSLKYSRYVDKETLITDVSGLTIALLSRSGIIRIDPENLLKKIKELQKDTHDPWQVCCGHDMVQILSVALRAKFGNNRAQDVCPDTIEKALHIGYEPGYFSSTNLYKSIKAWEKTNKGFTILSF